MRFVTLRAYEDAGGATRRDLFTHGEDGIFILQPDLLNDLVSQKLEAIRADVAAEGWAWVEVREEFDYAERSRFRTVQPEVLPLPTDLQVETEALEAELEAIYERDEEEGQARIDEVNERLEEIEEQRPYAWPEGAKETGGVVITIDYEGDLEITCGLIRPEDVKRERQPKPKEPGALPKSLTRDLRAHKSAALSAEMAARPDIALIAVVHALVCDAFYVGEDHASCLRISSSPGLPEDDTSKAWEALEQFRAAWQERLPEDSEALWDWCTMQEQSTLLGLLALCAALSINAVTFEDQFFSKALNLDMRTWFTPTAANYFSSVSKAQIIEALREAKGAVAPAWERAKKGELAAIAERELAGSGWLPALVRAA